MKADDLEIPLGDVCVGDLDSKNSFIAARGIETTADAIEKIDKGKKYASAISFLRQFAGVLYDYSTTAAQRNCGAAGTKLVN